MTNDKQAQEPWEATTRYGRADLTLDPLVREAFKIACLIERCGASEDLTRASSAAFALCESISDKLYSLAAHGIAQDAKLTELEELVEQFNDGHTPPEDL